jgi:hypothetical protein
MGFHAVVMKAGGSQGQRSIAAVIFLGAKDSDVELLSLEVQ